MVSGAALALLKAYDWPGNIRQLENAVFRAMVLCDGEMLGVDDFPQIRAQVEDIARRWLSPTLPDERSAGGGCRRHGESRPIPKRRCLAKPARQARRKAVSASSTRSIHGATCARLPMSSSR